MSRSPTCCNRANCSGCATRTSVLFADIDPTLLASIESSVEECVIAAGDSLYRVGDPGKAIFTIRDGLVKLVQYLPDGTQRIVRLVKPTEVAGLEGLLEQPYQHDAVVVQCATVCRIPLAVVNRLATEDPALHRELMRRWQRALSEADAWLTELSTGPSRQRVARLLLRLSGSDGTGMCPLFGRKDMGAMLGITTESASRVIAEFKRADLLEEHADGFHIDVPALQNIADD